MTCPRLRRFALVAPGATAGVWIAMGVGQAYIAGRVAVKLAFWAGAIEALQRAFNCPGFVRTAESVYEAADLQVGSDQRA